MTFTGISQNSPGNPRGIAEAIQGRHQEAEALFFTKYAQRLWQRLLKMTGNHSLADDLLQDTFGLVLSKIRKGLVKEPEKLEGYLYRVARNLFISHYRKVQKHAWTQLEDASLTYSHPGGDECLARKQEAQCVRRVLASLRHERDREVLYRFYLQEEDKGTICKDLELSPQQFNLILYRARQRFTELWKRRQRQS